jgi:hypothetical protein
MDLVGSCLYDLQIEINKSPSSLEAFCRQSRLRNCFAFVFSSVHYPGNSSKKIFFLHFKNFYVFFFSFRFFRFFFYVSFLRNEFYHLSGIRQFLCWNNNSFRWKFFISITTRRRFVKWFSHRFKFAFWLHQVQ